MKKIFLTIMVAALALTSCEKDTFSQSNIEQQGYGTLSFDDAEIIVSEETETRSEVDGYFIWVRNAEGQEVDLNGETDGTYLNYPVSTGISLPAGEYTLRIASHTNVAETSWSQPVYGLEMPFSITAGEVTTLGTLTCTQFEQVGVMVNYNDEFKKHIMGPGTTTVTIDRENILTYSVNVTANAGTSSASIARETRTGYLKLVDTDDPTTEEVETSTTMHVEFNGSMYDDNDKTTKSQKMRATITGIKPCQTREIIFNMTKVEDGGANFTITIGDLTVDMTLGEDIDVTEDSIGDDPNKPKGDGGIKLNWTAGSTNDTTMSEWNAFTTQNENGVVEKPAITIDETWTALTFNAEVPDGVYEFYVDITSDNAEFTPTVQNITVNKDGRIYLTKTEDAHRQVVASLNTLGIAFPYPEDVIDQDTIEFPLTDAIKPLVEFPGTHTFSMNVIDNEGHQNIINLNLRVE